MFFLNSLHQILRNYIDFVVANNRIQFKRTQRNKGLFYQQHQIQQRQELQEKQFVLLLIINWKAFVK